MRQKQELVPLDNLSGLGEHRDVIAAAFPDGIRAERRRMRDHLWSLISPGWITALLLGPPEVFNLAALYAWGILFPTAVLTVFVVLLIVATDHDLSGPDQARILKNRPVTRWWGRWWLAVFAGVVAWEGWVLTAAVILFSAVSGAVATVIYRRGVVLSIVKGIEPTVRAANEASKA